VECFPEKGGEKDGGLYGKNGPEEGDYDIRGLGGSTCRPVTRGKPGKG